MSGIYTNSLLNSSANIKTLDSYTEKATENFEAILEFNDDIFVADLIATRDFYKGLLESGEYVLNEGVFSAISALIQKIILAIKDAFNYIVNAVSTRKGKNKTFDMYRKQIAFYNKRVISLAKDVEKLMNSGKISKVKTTKIKWYEIPSAGNSDRINSLFFFLGGNDIRTFVLAPAEHIDDIINEINQNKDVEEVERDANVSLKFFNEMSNDVKNLKIEDKFNIRDQGMTLFDLLDMVKNPKDRPNMHFLNSTFTNIESLEDYRNLVEPLDKMNKLIESGKIDEGYVNILRNLVTAYADYLREITNKLFSYYSMAYKYTLAQIKEISQVLSTIKNEAVNDKEKTKTESTELNNCNTKEREEAQKAEFGPDDGVDDILDESSANVKEVDMDHDANKSEQEEAKKAEFGHDDGVDDILDESSADAKQIDMDHDANKDEQEDAKAAEFGPDDDVDKILGEAFKSDKYTGIFFENNEDIFKGDDHDYNEGEQEDAKKAEFGPSDGVDKIMDESSKPRRKYTGIFFEEDIFDGDDHDYNEDEQEDAKKAEFGPSDGVDDILDESSADAKQVDMKHDANENEQKDAQKAEFGPDDDVDKILDEFFSDVYDDNTYEYNRVLMEYEILADKYEARWNRMEIYKKAIIEEAKIRANPDADVLYEAAVVSKAAQTAVSGALGKELSGVLGKIVAKIKEIFNKFMEKLRASSPYTRTYLNKYKDIILRNKLPERSYDCKDLINGMHRVINYSIPAFNYNEIKDSLDSYATFFDKIRGTGTNFDNSFNGASIDPRTENTTKSIATYFKEYFGMTNEDTTHSAEEFERNMKDIYDFMYDVNKIEKSIKDDIRRVEAMQTNAAKQAGVPTTNRPTPAEDTVNARNRQNRQQQQEGYFSYMDNLEYLLEIKAKEDPNNMTGKVAGSVTNVQTDKNATAQNQYGAKGTPLDELNAKLKVYGEVTTAVLTAKLTAVEFLRNEFMWLFRHMVSRYVQGEQEPAAKTQAPARNTPEFVNTVRDNRARRAQQ